MSQPNIPPLIERVSTTLSKGIDLLKRENIELQSRWDKVRALSGAKTDDSVQEVFDRIEQHRASWDSRGGLQ